MAREASDTSLLGAAAEHYVMCQLLRRNMIAALAPVKAALICRNGTFRTPSVSDVPARILPGRWRALFRPAWGISRGAIGRPPAQRMSGRFDNHPPLDRWPPPLARWPPPLDN
jgi:hypothetical protein